MLVLLRIARCAHRDVAGRPVRGRGVARPRRVVQPAALFSGPAGGPARPAPSGSGSRWRMWVPSNSSKWTRSSGHADPGEPSRNAWAPRSRNHSSSRAGVDPDGPQRRAAPRRTRPTIRTGSQSSHRSHTSGRSTPGPRVERQLRTCRRRAAENARRAAQDDEQPTRRSSLVKAVPGAEVVPPPEDVAVVVAQEPHRLAELRHVAVSSYSASPACVASAPNRSGRSIGVIIAPKPPLDLPLIARDSRSAIVR